MVRLTALVTGLIVISVSTWAMDVQLLDPEALGQPTSQAVKLLFDKKPDDAEPYVVSIDVEHGHYAGASVRYRQTVPMSEVRAALMRRYAKWVRPTSGEPFLWRVMAADGSVQFVIQLAQEEDGPVAIYLRPASYSRERLVRGMTKGLAKALAEQSGGAPSATPTPSAK